MQAPLPSGDWQLACRERLERMLGRILPEPESSRRGCTPRCAMPRSARASASGRCSSTRPAAPSASRRKRRRARRRGRADPRLLARARRPARDGRRRPAARPADDAPRVRRGDRDPRRRRAAGARLRAACRTTPMPGVAAAARIEMIRLLARASGTRAWPAARRSTSPPPAAARAAPDRGHARAQDRRADPRAVLMACAARPRLPGRERDALDRYGRAIGLCVPDRRRPARRARRSRGDRQGGGLRRAARQADVPGGRGRRRGALAGRRTRRARRRGARGFGPGAAPLRDSRATWSGAAASRGPAVCPLPALQ